MTKFLTFCFREFGAYICRGLSAHYITDGILHRSFLKFDRDIPKIKKTILGGLGMSRISDGGHLPQIMVGTRPKYFRGQRIFCLVRWNFVTHEGNLFHFMVVGHSYTSMGWGTHLWCIYCLVPYTDLSGWGVFWRLTWPLFPFLLYLSFSEVDRNPSSLIIWWLDIQPTHFP